jgi:hypothetical protein
MTHLPFLLAIATVLIGAILLAYKFVQLHTHLKTLEKKAEKPRPLLQPQK